MMANAETIASLATRRLELEMVVVTLSLPLVSPWEMLAGTAQL
jgi:hypothetical protein